MSNEDSFVALSECHFMNPQTLAETNYYPNTQRWWTSVDGVMRAWSGRDLTGEWPHPLAEELIKYMDEARVDVREETSIEVPEANAKAVFITDPDGTLIELVQQPGD